VAEGAAKLVQAGVGLAAKYVREQDATIMQKNLVDATALRQEAEDEFLQLKGTAAIGDEGKARQDAEEAYSKKLDELMAGMPADRHRAMFEGTAEREKLAFQKSTARHANREADQLFEDSNSAGRVLAEQEGRRAAADGDMTRALAARDTMIALVDSYAQKHGMKPETKQAMALDATTKVHVGVLDVLTRNDQFQKAGEYLDATRKEIDQKALRGIEDAIKAASTRVKSAGNAEEIFDLARQNQSKWSINVQEATQAVFEIEDIEERDATMQRLQRRIRLFEQARRANAQEPLAILHQQIIDTGSFDRSSSAWTTDLLEDEDSRAQVKAWAKTAKRSRRSAGAEARREQREIDRIARQTYYMMDPEDRVASDIRSEFRNASPLEQQTLLAKQANEGRNLGGSITDFSRRAKVKALEFSDRGDRQLEFNNSLMERWTDYQEQHPKESPPPELQAKWLAWAAQEAEIETAGPSLGFGRDVRGFRLKEGDVINAIGGIELPSPRILGPGETLGDVAAEFGITIGQEGEPVQGAAPERALMPEPEPEIPLEFALTEDVVVSPEERREIYNDVKAEHGKQVADQLTQADYIQAKNSIR
jgi:hypothetical protein